MNHRLMNTGLIIANFLIDVFCGFGCVAFTRGVYVRTGVREGVTYTSMGHGGASGAWYRYAYCAGAALFLQGVLAIFNLSVLQWTEPDRSRANRLCAGLAAAGFGGMMLIAFLFIGLPEG